MSFTILSVGEVLWDLLPTGAQLGGAPANFAIHAHALGADARLVSRIGRDELGDEILQQFEARELPTETIQHDGNAPTGTVGVDLDAAGQPRYTIYENAAWDRIVATEPALQAASRADAICFGSLAQRGEISRAAIRMLVGNAPASALKIFDVNLRQNFYTRDLIADSLAFANAVKLNDDELRVLAPMFGLSGDEREQLAQLGRQFDLRLVALTRGANGSVLIAGEKISEHDGVKTKVADTIGAGDSYTAAMAIGFFTGWPLDEINARAAEIAAFVCSQSGATPPLPGTLSQVFRTACSSR